MTEEADRPALRLRATARTEEQGVRVVPDDALAVAVRFRVRVLAAHDGIAVRTARVDDTVVVVCLDAEVWTQDTATMREKLTPHGER